MSIKIGFIGVGGIAQSHINQLRQLPNAEIVKVFDVNKDAAIETAEKVGAQVADSPESLLNPNEIDAVYICTPQFARGELEVEAARQGIPFFVEKPLGVNLDEVSRKATYIRDSGIVHGVGYVLRYYDTVREAKEYLRGKDVFMVQANRIGGAHDRKWWRQLHMSGGNLVDAATHQADMVRYLAGDVKDVYAKFSQKEIKKIDAEATIYDAGSLTFTMQSGAVGSLQESCLSKFHKGAEVRVYGFDFFVHLSGNGKTLTIMDEQQNTTRVANVVPMMEQAKAFLQAVETGSNESILCNYDDGLKTLEFILGANRSAEEQRTIELS